MNKDSLGREQNEEVFDDYVKNALVEEKPKPRKRGREASASTDRGIYRTKNPISQTGELDNISKGISPFSEGNCSISPRDSIELMQKAYYNVACVRGAIDILSDLANSKIKFRGKNKSAVKFFTAWDKKIGGWDFRGRFFKEFWRSSNVFIYKQLGELTYSEYRRMSRAATSVTKEIPIKYIILNPADISAKGAASFVDAIYTKALNTYELQRLRSPNLTAQEQEFLDSLSPQNKKEVLSGQNPSILLSPDKLITVFNGKLDYEPMATPCFFSVLQDVNFKIELRKNEMILARTADKYLLLITAGEKEREHTLNAKLINGLTQMFAQDSIGRVLVSDYTTKADFVIPDFNKIFGQDKYKSVNEDIANGLMNIFWKDESFSNSMIKIQIFLERLKTARESYINLFLRPEMEKIAEILGFQDVDDIEVDWEDFNLKDDLEYKKLYTRLAELGLLTASETFDAFKTHQLPTPFDSIENQKNYKKQRNEELYEPLVGGPKETTDEGGRPKGAKAPKKKINTSPVGASYSLSQISDNVKMVNSLSLLIEAAYKEKNKLTRLSKRHKELCWSICSSLVVNEPKELWESKVVEYLTNPLDQGPKTDSNFYLAATHNVDPVIAAILGNSSISQEAESV